MRFVQPGWLWIGLVVCGALAVLMVWSAYAQRSSLARFVAARHVLALTASLSPWRRRLKRLSMLLATGCVFAALARPQWGYHEEKLRRQGIDLLFAVDTSKSMLAEDLRPSRMARAQLAVQDLADQVDGDRLGLVAFAGDAFLQTPLTHDRSAFAQSLQALEAGIIPVAGTDIESAIRVAEQAFASEPDHQKLLVLLTDGEDLSGSAVAAARKAAEGKLAIHTIGIGTAEGSTIPVRTERGGTGLLRGPDGEIVRSRLDEGTLRQIAEVSGGTYRALGASGQGLQELHRDVLAKLQKQTLASSTKRVFHERFQWPLGIALALLLIEWLVHERRRGGTAHLARASRIAALALVLCVPNLNSASAADGAHIEHYNGASADYRAGKFEQAAEGYRRALDTRDLTLQQRTYYDLGNALYRSGQPFEQDGRARAIELYQQSVQAYDAALALNADDGDARFNRDVVQRKLEQLEKESNQQRAQGQQGRDDPSKGGAGKSQGQRGDGAQQAGDARQTGNTQQSGKTQQNGDAQQSGKGADGSAQSDVGDGEHEGADAESGGDAKSDPRGRDSGESAGEREHTGKGDQRGKEPASTEGGDDPARAANADDPGDGQAPGDARGKTATDRAADAATNERSTALAQERGAEGAGEAPPGGAQAVGAKAAPGEAARLTAAQARRLLDSLAGELRQLPSGYGQPARRAGADERLRKDW
jgi:Ca-activated chloride channel family protein